MTIPDRKPLTAFEGSDVVAAKIEIPDAAGGLRDALAVDPIELHLGDEVHIVLHCRVKKVRFDPVNAKAAKRFGEDSLKRVHVFETIEAAFIESDQVAEHVRENALKVKVELEKLAGVLHLDDELDDSEPVVDAAAMVRFYEDRKADKPKARKDLA